MHSEISCFRWLIGCWLMANLISPNSAHADDLSAKWHLVVDSYINMAFSGGKRPFITKFDLQGPIPLEVNCSIPSSAKCAELNTTLSHAVQTNLNVRFSFGLDPAIRVEFFPPESSRDILGLAQEEFVAGTSDVSDPECMTFMMKSENVIVKSKILISSGQPENKLKACISEQFARALGLGSVGDSGFATLWTNGLRVFGDQDYVKLEDSNGILEYVHQCPEIQAGMTAAEVRSKLELKTSCISKLGGVE